MNPWTWLGVCVIAACGVADAFGWVPTAAAGVLAAGAFWLVLSAWGRRGGRHVR